MLLTAVAIEVSVADKLNQKPCWQIVYHTC